VTLGRESQTSGQGKVEVDSKVIQDLFPSEELDREMKEEPFDIITSIAICYDLEDPVTFETVIFPVPTIESIKR